MASLSLRDRPREKLDRAGVRALGDNELLALVIGHGTAGAGALDVANAVLAESGGLHGLARVHRGVLCKVQGVGDAMASRIQAAVELGRRTLLISPPARQPLSSARDTARLLAPEHGAYPVERFGVVLLDTKLRLIGVQLISSGSLDAAMAHPREVFREALAAGAAAIVLFHNHPSGDPQPSPDDVQLTIRLWGAGEVMGIHVVDHLVLANAHYSSMKDNGIGPWRRK